MTQLISMSSPLPTSVSPSPIQKTVAYSLKRATGRFLLYRQTEMDVSAQTLAWYRQKFKQLEASTGIVNLADLSRDDLVEFIGGLREAGRSPHYIRGWHLVFRVFFGWAREEGFEIHPSLVREGAKWFAMKKPIETEVDIEIFTSDEMERVYEAAGQPRNRVFCQVLAGTGARISEALALSLEDVQGDQLRIRKAKGRKPRWVPLSRQLQRELNRYIEKVRPDYEGDSLFPNRSGLPWSRSSAEELLARIRQQTGIEACHAHTFRHTFATTYLRNGGSIERLRMILGHTTFKMVMRYVHFAGVDIGRGINELAPF